MKGFLDIDCKEMGSGQLCLVINGFQINGSQKLNLGQMRFRTKFEITFRLAKNFYAMPKHRKNFGVQFELINTFNSVRLLLMGAEIN